MKLLFYIHTMQGGGAERVMSVICNELAERGHDVAVDTSYPIVYPLNGNVDVIDISLNGKQKKLTDNIPASKGSGGSQKRCAPMWSSLL